jgi:hypothetical protein
MYHAIISEEDCIEVFPDKETRNAMLCYYYDIEFECAKLDIEVSHRGELEEWVEREYPGITLKFANPRETKLQLEIQRLRKHLDEVDEIVGRIERSCIALLNTFSDN